jgi:hypothetical protein
MPTMNVNSLEYRLEDAQLLRELCLLDKDEDMKVEEQEEVLSPVPGLISCSKSSQACEKTFTVVEVTPILEDQSKSNSNALEPDSEAQNMSSVASKLISVRSLDSGSIGDSRVEDGSRNDSMIAFHQLDGWRKRRRLDENCGYSIFSGDETDKLVHKETQLAAFLPPSEFSEPVPEEIEMASGLRRGRGR